MDGDQHQVGPDDHDSGGDAEGEEEGGEGGGKAFFGFRPEVAGQAADGPGGEEDVEGSGEAEGDAGGGAQSM